MSEPKQCPKCKYFSGDDWRQCEGECPMTGSPHYRALGQTVPNRLAGAWINSEGDAV